MPSHAFWAVSYSACPRMSIFLVTFFPFLPGRFRGWTATPKYLTNLYFLFLSNTKLSASLERSPMGRCDNYLIFGHIYLEDPWHEACFI